MFFFVHISHLTYTTVNRVLCHRLNLLFHTRNLYFLFHTRNLYFLFHTRNVKSSIWSDHHLGQPSSPPELAVSQYWKSDFEAVFLRLHFYNRRMESSRWSAHHSPPNYRSANTTFPQSPLNTLSLFFPHFHILDPWPSFCCYAVLRHIIKYWSPDPPLLWELEVRRESVLANKQKARFKRQFEGQSQSSPLCDHHHHHCKSQINL